MSEFQVWIKVDDDEMQTSEDVAGALRDVANRLSGDTVQGSIKDLNGNTVGAFMFLPDEDDVPGCSDE